MSNNLWPVPVVDRDSELYWKGCQQGKLLIQRCQKCSKYIFYPRVICPFCMSDQICWIESSGRGEVYSYTIVHRPRNKVFAAHVPYVVALITLEEGVRMMSNLINVDPDEVRCGMPVEVVFEKVNEEVTLPKFQPRRGE